MEGSLPVAKSGPNLVVLAIVIIVLAAAAVFIVSTLTRTRTEERRHEVIVILEDDPVERQALYSMVRKAMPSATVLKPEDIVQGLGCAKIPGKYNTISADLVIVDAQFNGENWRVQGSVNQQFLSTGGLYKVRPVTDALSIISHLQRNGVTSKYIVSVGGDPGRLLQDDRIAEGFDKTAVDPEDLVPILARVFQSMGASQ